MQKFSQTDIDIDMITIICIFKCTFAGVTNNMIYNPFWTLISSGAVDII